MIRQDLFNITLDIDKLIAEHSSTINNLRQKVKGSEPFYKVLKPIDPQSIIGPLRNLTDSIKSNFTDLIVISMGGAHLNPARIINFFGACKSETKIHFIYRTEPAHINEVIENLDLSKCAVLTISKSGDTLETLAIVGCLIDQYLKKNYNHIDKNFFFITNTQNSKLSRIAKKIGGTILEHDQTISGRYSGLSNTSLLPALVAGINAEEYIEGANESLNNFLQNDHHPAIINALITANISKSILVNIAYSHNLTTYLAWQSQIIAESLGKGNKGFTPIISMGPEDQHSMYQLYLDGPDDKFYSYYCLEKQTPLANKQGIKVCNLPTEFDAIAGMELEEIHQVNMDASFAALKKVGRPLRKIAIKEDDPYAFGQLTALSMIEVILLAEIFDVNPFNQPGVEHIKSETTKVFS